MDTSPNNTDPRQWLLEHQKETLKKIQAFEAFARDKIVIGQDGDQDVAANTPPLILISPGNWGDDPLPNRAEQGVWYRFYETQILCQTKNVRREIAVKDLMQMIYLCFTALWQNYFDARTTIRSIDFLGGQAPDRNERLNLDTYEERFRLQYHLALR